MKWNTTKSFVVMPQEYEGALRIGGAPLLQTRSAKYLGVVIDAYGITAGGLRARIQNTQKRAILLQKAGLGPGGFNYSRRVRILRGLIRPMYEYALHLQRACAEHWQKIWELEARVLAAPRRLRSIKALSRFFSILGVEGPETRRIILAGKAMRRMERERSSQDQDMIRAVEMARQERITLAFLAGKPVPADPIAAQVQAWRQCERKLASRSIPVHDRGKMLPCARMQPSRFASVAVQWYFGLFSGMARTVHAKYGRQRAAAMQLRHRMKLNSWTQTDERMTKSALQILTEEWLRPLSRTVNPENEGTSSRRLER